MLCCCCEEEDARQVPVVHAAPAGSDGCALEPARVPEAPCRQTAGSPQPLPEAVQSGPAEKGVEGVPAASPVGAPANAVANMVGCPSGAGPVGSVGIASNTSSRRPRTMLNRISSLDPMVARLVSFQGCSELLRGSRLSSVMNCGAAILTSNLGSAATYELSEKVVAIQVFISHNWSVSRRKKFFCLALYFNFHHAACIALVALVAFGAATAQGLLPRAVIEEGVREPGLCCRLLVAPLFLLAVCSGHELRRLGRCCDPVVFLDKTCIHQSDKILQQQSIKKLGAFIHCSSRMVIVYSDIYLKKLWTVYEVACFLSLHPTSNLSLVPTSFPLIILGGIAALYFFLSLVVVLMGGIAAVQQLGFIVNLLTIFAASLLLRHLARAREAIRQRLANFQVEDCVCACEEDRPVVYGNIALLMRATGEASSDDSDEAARQSFNRVVRESLCGPFIAAARLEYFQCIALCLCGLMPSYVDMVFGIYPWSSARQRGCSVLNMVTFTISLFPLALILLSKWCECCLGLSHWKEKAFLFLGSVLLLGIWVVLQSATDQIWYICIDPDIGFIAIAIPPGAALLAIAAFAYERRAPREMDNAAEPGSGPGEAAGEEAEPAEENLEVAVPRRATSEAEVLWEESWLRRVVL